MELLPTSAPVYGGGLIVAFLPEDYNLADNIRAFLVFKGSRQRQVTEAKISIEDNAFHAVVPDHEPPEQVSLSAYIQLPDQTINCIATEEFNYYLDQTCYLARYLADRSEFDIGFEPFNLTGEVAMWVSYKERMFSLLECPSFLHIHNLDSLEDWDSICGENFSLEQEDFGSLDERLTSAFQHLILPNDWNLLGDATTAYTPRETLFHFASRLGLSTFVTLLLEKPGAEACLQLKNKHDELARDIAMSRGFDGLADLITDPHAHGVIKWESKEEIGQAVILTRHSFGTVSTSADIKDGDFPPLNVEIRGLCRSSGPPDTPIPYGGLDAEWDGQDASLHFPHGTYDGEFTDYYPAAFSASDVARSPGKYREDLSKAILDDSLNHLHEIGDEIHYLRHKDIARLREDEDPGRLSTSCPDLAHDAPPDADYEVREDRGAPTMPRDRKALPTDMERELESQLMADDDDYEKPAAGGALERRHSWHSRENLACDPSRRTRESVSDRDDEDADKDDSLVSPSIVRRGARKNMATFSLVSPPAAAKQDGDEEMVDRRTKSLLVVGDEASPAVEGRRHTLNEAVISEESATESTSEPQSQLETLSQPSQPVAAPPKPGKKLVTRKLSFLEKMRSSARVKQKEKGKLKTFTELKFGKASDEDSLDIGDASKTSDKSKRPTVLPERPRSMMINRQPPYSVGPTIGSYPASSSSTKSRPVSTIGGYQGNSVDQSQSSTTRSSFQDEEDGIASRLHYGAKPPLMSGSCESLDEVMDTSELESDPDLTRVDEPDSWSSTIDKKAMKKMSLSKKDVKRQENIFEFILTERNHLTTLKIMQKVYARGLISELGMDQATIDKLFPLIDEHVECVSQLVHRLIERQASAKVVCGIGDILVNHWEGSNGETVKRLFGDFCSKQNEITNFYKDMIKTDKKFHAFMKKCEKKPYTRRQDVQACALLITQRLTKYPIMLHTMLENSNRKDHKDDYHKLERALELSREIAKDVDEQVQMHEREILLMETYDKVDSKSTTTFKDRRFDRRDFLRRSRKLLYSSNLQWNKEGRKFVDIFLLLLTDCIVMLQDNGGRYTFLSGQPAAVPLQKMIVREVANDEKALYLMSMRTQQMYTLKLSSLDECKTLTNRIRLAIGKCPDEDEGITSEEEGERRGADQRMDKAKQMIKQLELTDQRIIRTLEEKMTFFKALAETAGRGSATADLHFSFVDYSSEEGGFPAGTPILLKAIEQVNKLTTAFYGPASSFKHTLSAGEAGNRGNVALPKRSDTFGGFDNGKEPAHPRVKYLNSSQSDSKLSDLEQSKEDLSSSNRDSGFHSELAMSHGSHSSIPKAWESSPLRERSTESDPPECTYLPPTADQVQALTSLAQILSEYQSFASQQDTLVEKLQQQLSGKKRSVGGGLQEAELKRNQIKQQEQMDDLRKQQQQLRNERDQWQRQVERFQRSLDNDRSEFEREKEKIAKEREENEKQRIEIQKAKGAYQREVKRLHELQRQTQHEIHTSSSSSSLPGNKNNSSNVDPISRSHSNLHAPDVSDGKHSPVSPTYAEGDYPRTYPSHKREPSNPIPQQLPIHMQYSIVNQQATTQRLKQQDVSKLASKLGSTSKATSSKPGSSEKGGLHQLIPGKLSKLAAQPHSSSSSKKHHIV